MGRKIWKTTKLAFLSILGLILATIAAGLAYRAFRHHEIARATAIDPANGVDEALFVPIGGIDQWITIRGQDRDNPVLLLLHGGPGVALSPYPRDVLFDWTKDFTLVQWDQRGSGKTYGRSGPLAADVTIDRMAQDGVEVAEFLRQHLHKQKIIILGLSWGTIVGVHMARARPDLFYAYVGTGQMVNERDAEPLDYRSVLDKARARGDQRAIAELEKIGPPPYRTQADLGVQRKWARAYEPGALSNLDLIATILFESDATPRDLRDYVRGIVDSQDHFFGEDMTGPLNAVDLPSLGTDFAIPFFVFQGAEDDIAPASLASAYVARITAPQKQFIAIPNAGHTALNTRSDEFLRLLDENARFLAFARDAVR
jgi:pimeloyl-ACP methyl ester carboxylesterase